MKKLFVLISMLFCSQVFAQRVLLGQGDTSVSLVDRAELISINSENGPTPRCPRGARCGPAQVTNIAVISVNLNGCNDRLGPVSYDIKNQDGQMVIMLSAVNINNERSTRSRCIRTPSKKVEIALPPFYRRVTTADVRLELLTPIFTGTLPDNHVYSYDRVRYRPPTRWLER